MGGLAKKKVLYAGFISDPFPENYLKLLSGCKKSLKLMILFILKFYKRLHNKNIISRNCDN